MLESMLKRYAPTSDDETYQAYREIVQETIPCQI